MIKKNLYLGLGENSIGEERLKNDCEIVSGIVPTAAYKITYQILKNSLRLKDRYSLGFKDLLQII